MQIKMQHGIDSNKLLNTVYIDTFVLYFTDCCIVFEHLVSSITNSRIALWWFIRQCLLQYNWFTSYVSCSCRNHL